MKIKYISRYVAIQSKQSLYAEFVPQNQIFLSTLKIYTYLLIFLAFKKYEIYTYSKEKGKTIVTYIVQKIYWI